MIRIAKNTTIKINLKMVELLAVSKTHTTHQPNLKQPNDLAI